MPADHRPFVWEDVRSQKSGVSELARFRYRSSRTILLFCGLTNAFNLIVTLAGAWTVPFIVACMTAFGLASCLALYVLISKRPATTPLVSWLAIGVIMAQTLVTFVAVEEDQARIAWFFPVVGAAFLIAGQRCGLIVTGVFLAALFAVDLGPDILSLANRLTIGIALLAAGGALSVLDRKFRDVLGTLEQSRAQLRLQASTDPLTGLWNRLALRERLDALENAGTPFALIVCDLDRFKRLNDRYGHLAGDRVLTAAAHCLQACAGEAGMAVRLGGEEFCLLLENLPSQEVIERVETLRRLVEDATILFEGNVIRVTASFGIAFSEGSGMNPDQIMQAADAALYAAKSTGRNRLQVAA